MLVVYDGVGEQIIHRHSFALVNDVWVFLREQPANVGEEETPLSVVGVGMGLAELVVYPVVPCPDVHAVLYAHNHIKS